jgi:hypothetical protein
MRGIYLTATWALLALVCCCSATQLADPGVASAAQRANAHKRAVASSRPPRRASQRVRQLLTSDKRAAKSGGPHARASYFDATGRVDSLAYCYYTGGLQQLDGSGGITESAKTWHASTGEPARVLPTIAGEQQVAVQIKIISNTGALLGYTNWNWATVDSVGYFKQFYSFSADTSYSFVDATTGKLRKHLDVFSTPSAGTGVRFTMGVAWYTNGYLSRSTSSAVPWASGNVGAPCWQL